MDIKKTTFSFNPIKGYSKNNKKSFEQEGRTAAASAQNAMEQLGRAQLNINFKGNYVQIQTMSLEEKHRILDENNITSNRDRRCFIRLDDNNFKNAIIFYQNGVDAQTSTKLTQSESDFYEKFKLEKKDFPKAIELAKKGFNASLVKKIIEQKISDKEIAIIEQIAFDDLRYDSERIVEIAKKGLDYALRFKEAYAQGYSLRDAISIAENPKTKENYSVSHPRQFERIKNNDILSDWDKRDFEEIKKSLISKGLQGKALDETLDLVKEHGNLSSLRYYIREDIDPELFIFKVKYNAYDSLELIKRTFGDLLNKELYKKSEEFLKRGISIENSLILSFFTFSNEEEIDRACELVKKGVQPFEAQKYSRTIESFSTLMAKENEYGKIDDYDYKIYSTDNIVEIIKEIRKEGIKPEEWYELNSKDIKDSNKVQIIKELKKGATLEEAIEIVENAEIRAKTDECMLFGVDEKNATKWAKAALDKYSFLGSHTVRFLIEGVDFAYANELGMNPDGPKARKFYNLMQRKKYSPELAQIIATTGIEEPEKVELMKKLLDKSFIKNIQKRIQNPNIDENIDNIFNIRNMNSYKAADLLNCGLSAEEIADSIVKLAKSPLKSALKKPNQYLSHIPLKYTTKINGKYPRLQGKELKNLQEKIEEFFQSNPTTLRAIKFLDNDTFNQMMDKRTADFEEILSTINTLTDENYRFVSELLTLKNSEGADLPAKDKIELCQTVTYLQAGKMVDDVKFVENNRLLPMDEIRKQVIQVALKTCDFTNQEIAKIPVDKLEFDKEYFSTIFQLTPAGSWEEFKKAILNQVKDNPAMEMDLIEEVENYINNPELGISRGYPPEACEALLEIVSGLHTLSDREQFELYKVVDKSQNENNRLQEVLKGALLGDFKTFIHDTSNPFGKANQKTKKVFEQKGINYNAWVNYQEQTSFELDNRTLTFKQWDRNPQKDLFIGNRTSCCTALNKTNGKSTPTYLANTAFNVVELKDNKDNTVMMARFVMAEVDSKPAIIIDTIELNNSFIKDLDLKNLKYKDMLRDKLFSYLKKYAKKLSKKPLPIYLSGSYLKVNNTGLEKVQKTIKLLGESSPNKFYLNAAKGWITQGEEAKQEHDFYEVN